MRRALTVFIVLLLAAIVAIRFGRRGRSRAASYFRMNPMLAALDRNKDTVLSADEIRNAPEVLRALDTNHDGVLTKDEMLPVFESRDIEDTVDTLMSFDRNGDGKLTPGELPERMRGLFDRGDLNRDGVLTREEARALVMHTPPPGQANEIWPDGFMRDDYAISAIDDNHDEIISADEIARAPERLRSLDRNGDGKLTADELVPIGMR